MRGAFVACFGGDAADQAVLERVAEAHRWHDGLPGYHAHAGLCVAVLAHPVDGPRVEISGDRIVVVHGDHLGGLMDLRRQGHRFVGLESDGTELWATRDPMGLCPLFYRRFRRALWFSTEVLPLVALGSSAPDLTALSSQIALVPDDHESGWTGIFRLLPGCTLHATRDMRLTERRYWKPRTLLASYKGGRKQAEELFRARLGEAVERCLSPNTGVMLSGGLDSAAITIIAGARAQMLRLVHVAFPGYKDATEEQHAQAIADAVQTGLDVIPGDTTPWNPEDDLFVSAIPYPTPPPYTANTALAHLAQHLVEVALDGNDGDAVLGHLGSEWGELALHGQLRQLAHLSARYGARTVLRSIAGDLVPPAVRFRAIRGRPPLRQTYLQATERYFAEPLRRRMPRVDLERWRQPFGAWGARQLRPVMPVTTVRMEEHELRGARYGLDMRHPFADRKLVEFLISLPPGVKSDPHQPKSLLRKALIGAAPELVLERPDKPLYFDVLAQRVDSQKCLEWIKHSGVRLPFLDYDVLYRDADTAEGVPLMLLMLMARVHVFAASHAAPAEGLKPAPVQR